MSLEDNLWNPFQSEEDSFYFLNAIEPVNSYNALEEGDIDYYQKTLGSAVMPIEIVI